MLETAFYAYIAGAFFTYVLLLETQTVVKTDWKAPVVPSLLWPVVWAALAALMLVYVYRTFIDHMVTTIEWVFDLVDGVLK